MQYEIFKDHTGEFKLHLKAANSEIIAASQSYVTRADAQKGIVALKKDARIVVAKDRTTA